MTLFVLSISADEAAWDPRVDVYFQKKAWMDSKLAVSWLRNTYKSAVKGKKSLLLADNLNAHTSDEFKSELRKQEGLLWLFPAGSTDMLQPVDAGRILFLIFTGLGRELKRLIGEVQDQWLEDDDNLCRWEDGTLRASDRRFYCL